MTRVYTRKQEEKLIRETLPLMFKLKKLALSEGLLGRVEIGHSHFPAGSGVAYGVYLETDGTISYGEDFYIRDFKSRDNTKAREREILSALIVECHITHQSINELIVKLTT